MQPLTLEEFIELAKSASKIAVFEEIPAGNLTPVMIYRLLNKIYENEGVLLEDLHPGNQHRYAYISFDPIESVSIPYGSDLNTLDTLRNKLLKLKFSTRENVAHLITKAIGFMTYDVAHTLENITDQPIEHNSLPLCLFHFYALNVTYDCDKQSILISTIVEINPNSNTAYYQARKKIQHIITLLTDSLEINEPAIKATSESSVTVDVSDTDFMHMVTKAKDYIIRGDAFQIVISRSFKRNYSAAPLEIYETLREVSPAPFMVYFPTASFTIIGASPERFIRVHQNEVTLNPIAGTRKRVKSDEAINADLLNDHKELAEHMMLVDLARNDAGAVSKPGSVHVKELLKVKHYSHISHITSTIIGQLHKNYDAFDALKAAFPAGTLSGAPKIRAMQIIAELEKSPRGLYGGAICRFDALDNLDSCIAIRMAVLQDGIATIRTGAGIVFDSDPLTEAQETCQKAYSLLYALAKAHGESHVTHHR